MIILTIIITIIIIINIYISNDNTSQFWFNMIQDINDSSIWEPIIIIPEQNIHFLAARSFPQGLQLALGETKL